MSRAMRAAAMLVAAAGLTVALSSSATAVPGGRLGLRYRCQLEATKLADDITVTVRVRTDRSGDEWRIRLLHEGDPVYRTVRRTNDEGNLTVVRLVPNLPGRDDLETRARHLETGELCRVVALV
jgi:hypothetical protein